MTDVRGLLGQKIIWDWHYRVFGFAGTVEAIEERGLAPVDADRTARLMVNYWEQIEPGDRRPGHPNFPYFVNRLIHKPAGVVPLGDYSAADNENDIYVMGSKAVEQVLAAEPVYTPIIPTDQNYDFEDIYDGISYMLGFNSSIARFLAFVDTVWVPYIGKTDTEFPDIPSFSPID